jgi:hypothetical protein
LEGEVVAMSRFSILGAVVAMLIGLVIAGQAPLGMVALDGTPAPDEVAMSGDSFEPLAAAGLDLPSPGGMLLVRINLEPGAALPPLPAAVEVAAYRIAQEALSRCGPSGPWPTARRSSARPSPAG